MIGKMKAALKVEAAPGAMIALVDIPQIGPRDVLVEVKAASICGTDVHIYEWDAWAQSRMQVPRIFGHEFAGEVVEVGSEVTSLVPGDFVAAETHIPVANATSAAPARVTSVAMSRLSVWTATALSRSMSPFPPVLPGRPAERSSIALPRSRSHSAMLYTPSIQAKLRTGLWP